MKLLMSDYEVTLVNDNMQVRLLSLDLSGAKKGARRIVRPRRARAPGSKRGAATGQVGVPSARRCRRPHDSIGSWLRADPRKTMLSRE